MIEERKTATTQADVLKSRTKKFGLQIIKLFQSLPRSEEARILGKQLLRSTTSVGANYRVVCRARSKAEFIAKMGVVVEEADETVYRLEMLEDSGILDKNARAGLLVEGNELLAIFAASLRTAKLNAEIDR